MADKGIGRLSRRSESPMLPPSPRRSSRRAIAATRSASGTSRATSSRNGPKHNWPLQRGFDRFYGTITGGGNFFDPSTLTRDNKMIVAEDDPEYRPRQYYYTDAISDQAGALHRGAPARLQRRPFFLYVAYTAAHWPMQALPSDIARYKGKYRRGYEPTRAARFARMKKLGIIDPSWEMTPPVGNWETVTNQALGSARHGGVCGHGGPNGSWNRSHPWRVEKTKLVQGHAGSLSAGQRRLRRNRWARPRHAAPRRTHSATAQARRDSHHADTEANARWLADALRSARFPGPHDTFMAYGRGWAHVSNTPFREYKHWVHEGGIATPLIAHWPAGIDSGLRNKLVQQPGTSSI